MPMGTLTRKVSLHPRSGPPNWISTPPSTGPMATENPTAVPSRPKARPRSAPRKCCWIIPSPCGFSSPDPIPCASRAAFSQCASGASPAATEAAVNTPTPIRKNPPRPRMSPARPAATRITPKVSA